MNILDTARHRRALRKWQEAARRAPAMETAALRRLATRARPLLDALTDVIRVADTRLAQPVGAPGGSALPHGTDWSWRPAVFQARLARPGMTAIRSTSMLGDEVRVFHDCPRAELAMRQARSTRTGDRAPYGLHLDVFAFEGAFLSLVLDLPQAAMAGLTRHHLVRLDTVIELEKPQKIFARLNVKHGPNTEQVVRELPLDGVETAVEFDLATTQLNERRLDRAWIDLIFDAPHMSGITLRDVILSRCPRADL